MNSEAEIRPAYQITGRKGESVISSAKGIAILFSGLAYTQLPSPVGSGFDLAKVESSSEFVESESDLAKVESGSYLVDFESGTD